MAVRSYFGTQTEAARSQESGGPDTPADRSAAPRRLSRTKMRCRQRGLRRRHPAQQPHRARGCGDRPGGTPLGVRCRRVRLDRTGRADCRGGVSDHRHPAAGVLGLEHRQDRDQSSSPAREAGRARTGERRGSRTRSVAARNPASAGAHVSVRHDRDDGADEHGIGDGRQYRAAVGGRRDCRHRGRLRRADAGSRHPLRHLFPVRRRLPDRRIHRCRRGQGHGRTHVDPRADAAPPARATSTRCRSARSAASRITAAIG